MTIYIPMIEGTLDTTVPVTDESVRSLCYLYHLYQFKHEISRNEQVLD